MEKVQFQLEATLPELKDLHEKGLFTKHEIDQITKKRTQFETNLIRRDTRKDDFFKYAEYEINLERLRRVRWKRLGYHLNPPPPSASSYSLPRRTLYILKRATAKFAGDLAVWLAYIEYASREGMRKVVAKGLNSALQHHPLSSTLYLLLSYHHLHPTSPFPRDAIPSASTSTFNLPSTSSPTDTGFSLEGTSAARTTILLGLRLVPESPELWTEYVKLELGWVEALRRRWEVLGISDMADQPGVVNPDTISGGEGSFGPDGEDARKAIMAGQLVIHALTSALEAIKPDQRGFGFRARLIDILRSYPSALRNKCLNVLYDDLDRIAAGTGEIAARARLVNLTKELYDRPYEPGQTGDGVVLEGVELVEALGKIGKAIRKSAKSGGRDWLETAGEWLSDQIQRYGSDDDLRDYLFTILSSLTSAKLDPPPSLLLLHLGLLSRSSGDSAALLSAARSHAKQYPAHAGIQLFRLRAEVAQSDNASMRTTFEEVVRLVSRADINEEEEEDVRRLWFCWTSFEERKALLANPGELDGTWRKILSLSTKLNRPNVHTALLGRYFISTLQLPSPPKPVTVIDRLVPFRPTPAFYAIAFAAISVYSQDKNRDLSRLYEIWRGAARSTDDKSEAGLTWARWLLTHGKALESTRVIDTLVRENRDIERRWKIIMDETGGHHSEEGRSKEVQLDLSLRAIGWPGLSTPDGVSTPEEDTEGDGQGADEDEDEDMDDDEAQEDGEEDAESDSDMEVAA